MASRLFHRMLSLVAGAKACAREPVAAFRGAAPDRPRLYAIGDVHGCADLLERLLGAIEADAVEAGVAPCVVFLGDLIDRGPDSRTCLDLVRDTLRRWPGSRFVLGNHDDCLLSFFGDAPLKDPWFSAWMDQGGRETILSYGQDPDEPKAARRALRERHADHAELLHEASIIEIDSDFVFVHAGVDPGRALRAQTRSDCLSIRGRFMNHVGPLERVVVHGHTPQKPPVAVATENRISLDTGAYFSGVLTALVIDRRTMALGTLSTRRDGRVVHGVPVRLDRGLGTALDGFVAAA